GGAPRPGRPAAGAGGPPLAPGEGLALRPAARAGRSWPMSDAAGETLRARLERRPLLLAEALDLAAQIAAELAAAHERGTVHGALEPAQVRICPVEQVQ